MEHSPAFLKLVDDAKERVSHLGIADAHARIEKDPSIRLIDIREDREWALGHIAGATHMGKGIIERDIEKAVPDKGAEIILYCGGGYRSVLSAEALGKMGYTNVHSIDGGWREWVAAGLPVDI
jgi:rhodanese-related sulfurtransferase